ncbi:hypothetical protein [Marinobacterium aestuariivivens]|uniref:Uncharacterized protein n=1 Tax=Marinobacterium aestuariivivens TaxID=1698799 RepID=A0ABW2AA95_9GAMM
MTAMTVSSNAAMAFQNKGRMAMNHLSDQAGFLFKVTVTPRLIDRVFLADGKHSVDGCLSLFLRTCAQQVKIAITDNKCWKRTRFYYPMPNLDDSFTPEEVVIKTYNADVVIMLASEEALIAQ